MKSSYSFEDRGTDGRNVATVKDLSKDIRVMTRLP